MTARRKIANKIYELGNGDTFDFHFKTEDGTTIYAAATCMRIHDLNRVIVSAYGRNEYDRIISEFDTVADIEKKLDFICE